MLLDLASFNNSILDFSDFVFCLVSKSSDILAKPPIWAYKLLPKVFINYFDENNVL